MASERGRHQKIKPRFRRSRAFRRPFEGEGLGGKRAVLVPLTCPIAVRSTTVLLKGSPGVEAGASKSDKERSCGTEPFRLSTQLPQRRYPILVFSKRAAHAKFIGAFHCRALYSLLPQPWCLPPVSSGPSRKPRFPARALETPRPATLRRARPGPLSRPCDSKAWDDKTVPKFKGDQTRLFKRHRRLRKGAVPGRPVKRRGKRPLGLLTFAAMVRSELCLCRSTASHEGQSRSEHVGRAGRGVSWK